MGYRLSFLFAITFMLAGCSDKGNRFYDQCRTNVGKHQALHLPDDVADKYCRCLQHEAFDKVSDQSKALVLKQFEEPKQQIQALEKTDRGLLIKASTLCAQDHLFNTNR